MNVFVNGEAVDCETGITIVKFVERHGLNPQTILVEQNGFALPRRDWSERTLHENDRLEILRVSAGG